MSKRSAFYVLQFAAIAAVLSWAAAARSCSCDFPDIGYLAHGVIEIPKNARGILWSGVLQTNEGLIKFPSIEHFHIEVRRDARWETVRCKLSLFRDPVSSNDTFYDVLIVGPEEDARPNAQYRYVYRRRIERELIGATVGTTVDSQVVFVTVAQESFTGSFRQLPVAARVQHGQLNIAVISGECGRNLNASWIDIDQVLPPEQMKWVDSFYFSTRISLTGWHPKESICSPLPPGRSWVGPGKERLYKLVDASKLGSGVQERGLVNDFNAAAIIAWLPGTTEKCEVMAPYSFAGK